MDRRKFLGTVALLAGSSGIVFKIIDAYTKSKKVDINYLGQDSTFLHKIRGEFDFLEADLVTDLVLDCLILGSGISGLSSIYHLEQNKNGNYLVLEAQNSIGGNSQSGENELSKFPFGAHYLPLPDIELKELREFLVKSNIAFYDAKTGDINYNLEYLIHAPETKLLYLGNWHDGLIPYESLSRNELIDIDKFNQLMDFYKERYGVDKKIAFAIPICNSSEDEEFLELDKISFKNFLDSKGLISDFVRWFANYGTRDDYGSEYDKVSAWAGIHYFASRASHEPKNIKNKHEPDILTWPEGNGFLVKKLKERIKTECRCDSLVLSVEKENGGYLVYYLEKRSNKLKKLRTKSIISSLPHFINKKIFKDDFNLPNIDLEYKPWLVANLNIKDLPEKYKNIPWDSISYHSDSLGFVRADHQNLFKKNEGTILTYYYSYSKISGNEARQVLSSSSLEHIASDILDEVSKFFPELEKEVHSIDLWFWGHAMSEPKPGIMRKAVLNKINSINDDIYLAHTDYSGISIFEEAFYQGVRAASMVLK